MTRFQDRVVAIVAFGVSGIAAYLYLIVAGRALGPVAFVTVGALWSVVFLVTAAVAAPLELAVSRSVADARAAQHAGAGSVVSGAGLAATFAAVTLVLGVVAGPWLDDVLFGHQSGVALLGAVAIAGLLFGGVAKGASAGSGRMSLWGAYLLVDGLVRLGAAGVVAEVGATPVAFAAALAVGPWTALAALGAASWGHRHLAAGVGPDIRALVPPWSALAVGGAAAAALTYFGSILITLLQTAPTAESGAYIASLAFARLPLFLASPVVAIAVPTIAFSLRRGETVAAARTGLSVVGGGLVAAAATVVAGITLGGALLPRLMGDGFTLGTPEIVAVSIAAAGWLVATTSGSVAIASGRERAAAACWLAGLGAALVIAALPAEPDPIARTDTALVAGALVAAVSATALAWTSTRVSSRTRTMPV
jgi:O-antigen/teichoic acid export membrane protein